MPSKVLATRSQFCRYVPRIAALGGRVILEVQRSLHDLMQTLPGAAQIVSRGEPLPDFDMHCPMLGLPLVFGTGLPTIRARPPICSRPRKRWRTGTRGCRQKRVPRIGLVWSGRPEHNNDQNRSIDLASFLSPLEGIDATFVSLQREVRAADTSVLQTGRPYSFRWRPERFLRYRGAGCELDLVISVDTSVAHLAGTLGKPVCHSVALHPRLALAARSRR